MRIVKLSVKSNIGDVITCMENKVATQNYHPLNSELGMETKLNAIVIGATGEVGKSIVKELIKASQFAKVTLIVRRHLDLPETDENYEKIEQKLVDFEKLSESADAFKGHQVGFSALGTTRSKAGADGFYRVDHDYVVESAKLTKEGGCQHFHLVSSGGANKNSFFLYPKTKGQTEEDVSKLDFERLSIYRPGLLMVNREEKRTVESVLQAIAKVLDFGQWASIDVLILAKAIVSNTFRPLMSGEKIEIVSNSDAIKMGK
ncbi:Oxidoreductase HTATIP2, partial [Pseudolycoriella hygida]